MTSPEGRVMKVEVNADFLKELLYGVEQGLACVYCPAWNNCFSSDDVPCHETLMILLTEKVKED